MTGLGAPEVLILLVILALFVGVPAVLIFLVYKAVSSRNRVESSAAPIAGRWAPDPSGRHELRYWDGQRWTDDVSDNGVETFDPLP